MRNFLFVINPNAGKKVADEVMAVISRKFPKTVAHHIIIWEDKDNFDEIEALLRSGDYTHVVAVGGDGTVNRVAKSIIGTEIALAIIPTGSGNGLARTLGVSMDTKEAVKEIAEAKSTWIDYGLVNDIPFFCTSGIGFDAHIGNLFVNSISRGLISYIKITVAELFRYRAKNYEIHVNGEVLLRKAFLITVANAGQYGNDFYIAPEAKITDGLFHVVILKPFNFFSAFGILTRVLNKEAHLSKSIETVVADKLIVKRADADCIHFDGEPALQPETINYENHFQKLKVIVGAKYKSAPELIS